MKQFLTSNDEAFRDLEQRATGKCVRFRDQEMPRDSQPDRADVGFEIDEHRGTARLLVSRGVVYSGPEQDVRRWLSSGVKQFDSLDALRRWMEGPLSRAYHDGMAATLQTHDPTPSISQSADELTDIAAVRQEIRGLDRPWYLDEAELRDRLGRRVLGQNDALKGLSGVMVRHCARKRPRRPAVVFAVGPSGVGKTRSGEMLAEVLRELADEDNGYQFLRLDMSEYQESHRVSQLIGSPQGYIGHGDGSQLLETLGANPRTIVLFDEIEKAHPSILRVLMNAMDAGRLSRAARSGGSYQVDCRHAVFIFTSNVDAKEILDELNSRNAFGNRAMEDEVCRRRLHAAGIAPEIVGRIGRFLVFRPLGADTRAEIVALAIVEVGDEYGLQVSRVAPTVIVEIMRKTRSHKFGVRPERYLIDDELGGAFAAAAQRSGGDAVEVVGPPYECRKCEGRGMTATACDHKRVAEHDNNNLDDT